MATKRRVILEEQPPESPPTEEPTPPEGTDPSLPDTPEAAPSVAGPMAQAAELVREVVKAIKPQRTRRMTADARLDPKHFTKTPENYDIRVHADERFRANGHQMTQWRSKSGAGALPCWGCVCRNCGASAWAKWMLPIQAKGDHQFAVPAFGGYSLTFTCRQMSRGRNDPRVATSELSANPGLRDN